MWELSCVAEPCPPSKNNPTGLTKCQKETQNELKSEKSFVLLLFRCGSCTHLSSFLSLLTSILQVFCPFLNTFTSSSSLLSFQPLLVMRMWDGYESMSGLQQLSRLSFIRLPECLSVGFQTGCGKKMQEENAVWLEA